ncbi:MAG: T9SS type A sorting domain-containing protein [Bacteroidetes bacterium]|nr:T9SS type A sorting domain-containing protein [Bacteroidota bacterium]
MRKIPFSDTQGNISDENGDLLMSSNGYFIADATGDTMLNGANINPGMCTEDYGTPFGLPMPYANIILPIPGDTTKYVLIHQTCDYNNPTFMPKTIYYSIIDMTLNGGLGAVISKNNIISNGVYAVGITACKHANGRDWWIIALSEIGTTLYKFLLTKDSLTFQGSQFFALSSNPGQSGQLVFSPDGEKFAYRNAYNNGTTWFNNLRLFTFDRCAGAFQLDTVFNYNDTLGYGWGIMFSSNSRYLYFSSTQIIFQVDTDTSDIGATFQVISVNDTFLSAPPVFYTNFYLMYLAANGKIYTSSTSSVLHLHEMNYPDSSGLACDMQLHNIYTGHFFIGVPNHPNYYLGHLVGSPCDTLTSINDPPEHEFRFNVFPNPVMDGHIKIMYLLPQNKSGRLEIFDINGRRIYEMNLPYWSTMQEVSLPKSISSGVYNCVITSGGERGSKKVVVYRE